jgi:hypothetical protein
MNSNKRIAATVYSLGTLFVSGIYVQIPCIKEIMSMMMMIIVIIINNNNNTRHKLVYLINNRATLF